MAQPQQRLFNVTAFSAAIDAIFTDPHMAADALWQGEPVKVMRRAPDGIRDFGGGRVSSATTTVDVRVSEVPSPAKGDLVSIGDEHFVVQGTPQRDTERLVWSCDLRPAA